MFLPKNGYFTTSGWTNISCPYDCNTDKTGFNVKINPNCYSVQYFYVDKFGGYPVIVGVSLLILMFFGFFVIKMATRKKKREEKSSDFDQNITEYFSVQHSSVKEY